MVVTIIHRNRTTTLVAVLGGVPIGEEDAKPPSLKSRVLLIQDYNYIFVKPNHVSYINDTIVMMWRNIITALIQRLSEVSSLSENGCIIICIYLLIILHYSYLKPLFHSTCRVSY